ncbi:MAG TPA: hypothetical protein VMT53_06260 [Terriglobales bacterium]|nr:hypothetical protein [Terriglobales bacterium]
MRFTAAICMGVKFNTGPVPLQDASAQFQKNTMAAAAHISLPDAKPLLHFSKRQEVLIWPLTRVT